MHTLSLPEKNLKLNIANQLRAFLLACRVDSYRYVTLLHFITNTLHLWYLSIRVRIFILQLYFTNKHVLEGASIMQISHNIAHFLCFLKREPNKSCFYFLNFVWRHTEQRECVNYRSFSCVTKASPTKLCKQYL